MWSIFRRKRKLIDLEIDRVLSKIDKMDPETDAYSKAVANLATLHESRSFKTENSVSAETLVVAATSIVQILLVINHERLNVLHTNALGFVSKGRVQ